MSSIEKFPIDPDCEIFRWGPLVLQHFYAGDAFYAYTIGYTKKYMNNFWPKAVALFYSGKFVWIHDFEELRKTGKEVFVKYVNGQDYLKQKEDWANAVKSLHQQEEKIKGTVLSNLTDKELSQLLRETNELLVNFWLPTLPAELGNYGSIQFLEEELLPIIPDRKKLDEIVRILTTSEKNSFYKEEEIALQETNNLPDHQQKYFWLHNSFSGAEILSVDFFQKRKNDLKTGLRKDYEDRKKKIWEDKKKTIRENSIPENIVRIAERITDAMEFQDERKKEVWILQHYKQLLLNEVSNRTKKKNLEIYNLSELADILSGTDIQRKQNFGFILENGKMDEIDDITTEKYWNIYTKEKITDTTIIKGIVANTGNATGKVRIVLDPKDKNQEFNEGEILVAPMTSPDYVFLMKKASAIITDTGGLTSHAAIVSRELGKPCVIGTKNATKILKDGDLVEVDADNGTVHKIEKV
jgi:phosphohistidine swiveling domain-containing protein